ncbi:hypothetical protein FJ567_05565 [Mesorhizobium sp. B2-4-16]|nr:hypothetical protein FJ567_05540 [Mesorhizobium sp. B2-4-16]TPL03752.1 hypothetical protein FJ567_05565 [Mesorhizobium sp. B2-4-16]TPL62330.1 hypothetical protein FJ956_25285 [Mesorhizobium sp. B2-4-3]
MTKATPAGQHPPLPCRASPPQGGRLAASPAARTSKTWANALLCALTSWTRRMGYASFAAS